MFTLQVLILLLWCTALGHTSQQELVVARKQKLENKRGWGFPHPWKPHSHPMGLVTSQLVAQAGDQTFHTWPLGDIYLTAMPSLSAFTYVNKENLRSLCTEYVSLLGASQGHGL